MLTDFIAFSESTIQAKKDAEKYAKHPVDVSITGPTGSGKEVVARYIHSQSDRKNGPFIAINCSNLPESLAESLLFGSAKGSYTNSVNSKLGYIEQAHGGFLLLDELGGMDPYVQTKLLRVIEDKVIHPLGSSSSKKVDVRFIFAYSSGSLNDSARPLNLLDSIKGRVEGLQISLLPLSERQEDKIPLANHFLNTLNVLHKTSFKGFDELSLSRIQEYSWPLNVRQLEKSVQRGIIHSSGELLSYDGMGRFGLSDSNQKEREFLKDKVDGYSLPKGDIDIHIETMRFHGSLARHYFEESGRDLKEASKRLGITPKYLGDMLDLKSE